MKADHQEGAWGWNGEAKQNQREKRGQAEITDLLMPQTSLLLHCKMSAKKNHPRGYLEPISLLGECQISMNLTPLAKITCTNGNTQRHIPTPHLPQNYALKTFKVTAVIGLKNWLELPFRWIPNLTCNSNFGSSVLWLHICQMEMLMPCRQQEKQAALRLWNSDITWEWEPGCHCALKSHRERHNSNGKNEQLYEYHQM